MNILLIRFEKDKLHYIFTSDVDALETVTIIVETIAVKAMELEWEKYSQIIEELKLLNHKYTPNKIVFHSSRKYMWKIDELRFANECFLKYFWIIEKIEIIPLDKVVSRQILDIKQKDFAQMVEDKTKEILSSQKIAKSNKLLEGLVLLLLMKGNI